MATHLTQTCDVNLFAGAAAAAGTRTLTLQLAANATVADALGLLRAGGSAEFGQVLDRCTFLVDGVAAPNRETPVPHGCRLDVLPPFAGG